MITILEETPENVIAFRAAGEVDADDFKQTLVPTVEQHMKGREDLNYLLKIDTDLKDFTIGSWLYNTLLGIQQLTKWRKAAIICDVTTVKVFTDIFSKVMPGEYKVFQHDQYQEALQWVSN